MKAYLLLQSSKSIFDYCIFLCSLIHKKLDLPSGGLVWRVLQLKTV